MTNRKKLNRMSKYYSKLKKEIEEMQCAEQVYLKHYAENKENHLGLSETDVIVNAMIEFKNQK